MGIPYDENSPDIQYVVCTHICAFAAVLGSDLLGVYVALFPKVTK